MGKFCARFALIAADGRDALVVPKEHLRQNAHRRRCDDLVKGKADVRLEPSPEKELGLFEHHEGNEDRANESKDRCCNCTVGDDR